MSEQNTSWPNIETKEHNKPVQGEHKEAPMQDNIDEDEGKGRE